MNPELRKKLVIPFIIIVGFLAVNTDSMVKGIEQDQVWRVLIASVSDLLIIVLAIGLFFAIKKTTEDQQIENEG